jgi:hypothetical protein
MADEDQINTDEYVGIFAKEYASFAEDIDLVAAGPSGKSARQLWVLEAGSGALTLSTKYGDETYSGNLLESKNIPLTLGIFAIRASTTVTRVLVLW